VLAAYTLLVLAAHTLLVLAAYTLLGCCIRPWAEP
jgi:hypothetical protein